jgi:hypothetical protein
LFLPFIKAPSLIHSYSGNAQLLIAEIAESLNHRGMRLSFPTDPNMALLAPFPKYASAIQLFASVRAVGAAAD